MAIDDGLTRMRSYLAGQSAKLTVEEIAVKIEAAFGDLWQALEGLTPTQLTFKPGPEVWSIAEDITHLTNANHQASQTIMALASGRDVAGDDTSVAGTCDIGNVLNLAAQGRDQVVRMLRELPKEPDLSATAPYNAFGPLNCKEWLLFLRLHTLDHAQQAKGVREHPDFPR